MLLARAWMLRRLVAGCVLVLIAGIGVVALALRTDRRDAMARVVALAPRVEAGRIIQPLDGGGMVELTLDPKVQSLAQQVLADSGAAMGAAAVVSVDDGLVLALAGRARERPEHDDASLALSAWAPAASVFKLVTTAALLEEGVPPDTRVCYHEGTRSVESDNLEDDLARDERCRTLTYGLAKSQNAIIGRLAHDHLDRPRLEKLARAFGFGEAPRFELATTASHLDIPDEPLAFARTAAGFWHSTLSPLQGARLAATIARGGEAPPVRLALRAVDAQGQELPLAGERSQRVISESTARKLTAMMVGTTEWGSARGAFRDKRTDRRVLGRMKVAGKTGTLNGHDPFVAYSWFVGFAPADHPRIAFAVLLGNDENGRMKASEVARDLLARLDLQGH
jgi:penicillin-binding protein A